MVGKHCGGRCNRLGSRTGFLTLEQHPSAEVTGLLGMADCWTWRRCCQPRMSIKESRPPWQCCAVGWEARWPWAVAGTSTGACLNRGRRVKEPMRLCATRNLLEVEGLADGPVQETRGKNMRIQCDCARFAAFSEECKALRFVDLLNATFQLLPLLLRTGCTMQRSCFR